MNHIYGLSKIISEKLKKNNILSYLITHDLNKQLIDIHISSKLTKNSKTLSPAKSMSF